MQRLKVSLLFGKSLHVYNSLRIYFHNKNKNGYLHNHRETSKKIRLVVGKEGLSSKGKWMKPIEFWSLNHLTFLVSPIN